MQSRQKDPEVQNEVLVNTDRLMSSLESRVLNIVRSEANVLKQQLSRVEQSNSHLENDLGLLKNDIATLKTVLNEVRGMFNIISEIREQERVSLFCSSSSVQISLLLKSETRLHFHFISLQTKQVEIRI